MRSSVYISSAAHAGLLGWMMLGWGLAAKPLPMDVTEIAIVSGAAFDAAVKAGRPMAEVDQSPTPTVPDLPELSVDAPQQADPHPAPSSESAPDQVAPPTPAPVQQPPAQRPPQVQTDVPPSPVPDEPNLPEAATESPAPNLETGTDTAPKARPTERIAPIAAPTPDPAATEGDTPQQSTDATEAAPDPVPQQDQTAPKEAATEVVTEAEKPAFAPEISLRPQARRPRPAPTTPAQDPPSDAKPAETAPAETAAAEESAVDPLAAALAEAQAAETPQTAQQGNLAGQSLSSDEIGSFLGQIGGCWNIEAASTDAQKVIVSLSFELSQDGMLVPGSVQRSGYTGGTPQAADIAYRVAEQAVTECQTRGRNGYDLPAEKFPLWRRLKINFDPETMRLR